jgi:hypothetical protein
MRVSLWVLLALFIQMCAVGVAVAQDQSIIDVRTEVQRFCAEDDAVSAFHLAMKSLRQSEQEYGRDHLRTAECMVTVANVAKYREKYHLARLLYRRALPTLEQGLAPSHPDVVRCKLELSNLLSQLREK